MSMTAMVNDLASQGRNGDTLLAHITVEEAQLLKERGGSGTVNPDTGIMEFGVFSDLWNGFKKVVRTVAPIIIPAVAIFVPTLIPAIGTALGASAATASVIGAAALSAGVTLASGGSLKDVLTSAALAGASTYLTPIVGKALTSTGASTLTQIMAGSAAVGAGYTALRGGSVKEMMAAAATGAASAYLGNLARDSVAKMNNMMASNQVSGTITQKGATDATFVAADAANLKAAGLSQSEISKVLQSTGVSGTTADYAAQAVTNGMETSTLAANLAAGQTNGIYNGEANTKAVIAGNNTETMQRVEDAKFLAADAAQLRAQGLSANDIKQNLMASGVDANMANYAANLAVQGKTADAISSDIVNGQTYLTSGKIYTNSTNTIARDIGEVMDAQQTKEYKALPFKDLVNNGSMTIDEASVLGQNGVTPQQANDLIKLGYTASDLDNLIGAGVKIDTLTNLANTKFPETQINGLLQSGVSANDISVASNFVNNGKLSLQNADSILKGGLTGYEISNAALSGKANSIADLFSKGMTDDTYRKLSSSGMDFNAINNGVSSGKISANDLNWQTENNPNGYKTYINGQLSPTAQQPSQAQTTQPVQPSTGYVSPTQQITNTGLVNSVDAQVLANAGYTASDVKNLVNLGYTGADLADLASTGVYASTLTQLANTQFPESTINNLLTSGHSANEISKASFAVSNKGVSLNTATQLMEKGVNGNDIYSMSFTNSKLPDQALDLANKGVNADSIYKLYQSGYDLSKVSAGLSDGRLTASNVNTKVASGGSWATDINKQLAQPVAPKVTTPTAPPNTIDVGNGNFMDQYGNIVDINGNITQAAVKPPTPDTNVAGGQGFQVEVGGTPKYAGQQGAGTPPPGFQVATPQDVFGPNDTGSANKPFTSGTYYDAQTNTWFTPQVQPEIPEVVVTAPKPETPFIPVITPTIPTAPKPTVSAPTPVVTPQPQQPTVVSSSTRTTSDGSVYRDDQKSDGTVTTVLISGPTGTGGTSTSEVPEITITAPRPPPLTPPTQVVVPPGSSYVAPVVTTPDNTIPSNVNPGGSYDADIPETPPYIPIVTPPTTPAIPVDNTHYGTYKWGTPPAIKVPEGLNPGFITNVPDFYQPTNQAGSKYYWGAHPFQPGQTFDPQLYNQVPNAPVNPFGLGYAQRAATSQDILSRMQATQPVIPR